jgi:hypothetical protein
LDRRKKIMSVQFEYEVTEVERIPSSPHHLDAMGIDGWEMCGCVEVGHGRLRLFWKRRRYGELVISNNEPQKDHGTFLKAEDFLPPSTDHSPKAVEERVRGRQPVTVNG